MTWRRVPVKHLASVSVSNVDKKTTEGALPVHLVNYTDVYHGDRLTPAMGFMPATATRSQVHAFRLRPGDVVITKDSETAGDIGIAAFIEESSDHMVLGYHLALLRPRTEAVNGRFLYWAICSDHARRQLSTGATGVTRFGLRTDVIGSVSLLVPGSAEQRAIANYLDTETARIDSLITIRLRQADLLQERIRGAAEALVQAARPRWASTPLKYLVREIDDRLGDRPSMVPLSVSIHVGVVRRSSIVEILPAPENTSANKTCRAGDIVVNRMRAFHGGVGLSRTAGMVSPDYTVLRPGSINGRYLHHVLRSPWFVGEMTARLRGIGGSDQGNVRTPRINFADLGLIRIPVPPGEVQTDIADSLDRGAGRVGETLEVVRRQIVLLREHRQVLVTSVVTGELDIPGAAA